MEVESLFENLEGGELSEEQWEKFQEIQKQCGNLICNDFDLYDDEEETTQDTIQDPIYPNINLDCFPESPKNENEPAVESDSEDIVQEPVQYTTRDHELTEKYLKGEITFTQYSRLAEEDSEDIDAYPITEELIKESADQFSQELDVHKRPKSRIRNKLTSDLKGIMGEATICFAKRNLEEAIKYCLEVIRLAPKAPEPFRTLGMIYEDMENHDKSLQYSLIAAFLGTNDAEEWVGLAEKSLELADPMQAITCYTNALKIDPNNVGVHLERCLLFEQLGKKKKALEGYQQILKIMKPDQADQCWHLAREICKSYHEMGETKTGINVMLYVFEKLPNDIKFEDINILVELQVSLKMHSDAVQIFQKYGGVSFYNEMEELVKVSTSAEIGSVTKCLLGNEYPIDLRIKLVVLLIFLKGLNLVDELLMPLYSEPLEDVGDLYLDVAEAFMETGYYANAEPLLSKLVKSNTYNLAAVWLRYAESLSSLGKLEEAAIAYERVVEMAPNSAEARMSLSTLLQQLGRTEEAITVVSSQDDQVIENAQMSLQCCRLLLNQGNLTEFTRVARNLLCLVMPPLAMQEEVNVILNVNRRRYKALHDLQREKEWEIWNPVLSEADIAFEELWKLFVKVCGVLHSQKLFKELQHFTLQSLGSPPLTKTPEKQKEAEYLCLLSCYFNKNAKYGYNFIRDIVFEAVTSNRVWNLFSYFVGIAEDLRHNKFCLRAIFTLFKQHDELPLALLIQNAHNSLVAGSYKHAFGEYMSIYKNHPTDPFLSLMIGLTFIHLTSQKFTAKKHTLFIQAVAFLNQYKDLRGECQETLYNIGRAMHQLGLTFIAVHFYKKALEMGPCISHFIDNNNIFNLNCEIAYNLALIYQASGSEELAVYYINKYCII